MIFQHFAAFMMSPHLFYFSICKETEASHTLMITFCKVLILTALTGTICCIVLGFQAVHLSVRLFGKHVSPQENCSYHCHIIVQTRIFQRNDLNLLRRQRQIVIHTV